MLTIHTYEELSDKRKEPAADLAKSSYHRMTTRYGTVTNTQEEDHYIITANASMKHNWSESYSTINPSRTRNHHNALRGNFTNQIIK